MDGSGAEYLASIFGTEKDKVNCSFYYKMGACRHGDRCSRVHNRPTFSQTILIQNFYQNPALSGLSSNGENCNLGEIEMQEHYDGFFDEVYSELEEKYGEIEEMNVCDNLGDHLVGNVYVKFKDEEMSQKAVKEINNRWFDAKPIYGELSPVSDFREACCRQYELGECNRGGFCNFMHLKPISRQLRKALYKRNKHKKTEDKSTRKHTAGGRHGGYAGGFGGWSGVGDGYDDQDYGYGGRSSTQYAAERKFDKMESDKSKADSAQRGYEQHGQHDQQGYGQQGHDQQYGQNEGHHGQRGYYPEH